MDAFLMQENSYFYLHAQGLDRQILIFWNSRVNELCVSYTSQTTIYGIVDFEWLEKKTHHIQEKAMGFESKVLLKNIKRVDDIHVRVFRNAQIRNSTQGLVKSLSEDSIKGLLVQFAIRRAIKTATRKA